MPKVKVESQSKHTPQDTFQKIKTLLESDRELRKMDSSYVCNFNEQAMTGSAKGSKFQADMRVTTNDASKGAGCTVEIEVNLPLMLTPVKGIVQSTLQKKLESALS
jgi:hypothetical protein